MFHINNIKKVHDNDLNIGSSFMMILKEIIYELAKSLSHIKKISLRRLEKNNETIYLNVDIKQAPP